MLQIIYQDDHYIAINKPHGLLTHPSPLAANATETAMQSLRNQIGRRVYAVHRLDRKTGGVLLFTLDAAILGSTERQFAEGKTVKKYLAIVRGYPEDSGEIDSPLRKENGKLQEAFTAYKTLARAELNIPFGKHQTSRYSLVEAQPFTGRMHQIRRHFSHIMHPIIGDRPHGCNKQNRFFMENWSMTTMMLHGRRLEFESQATGKTISLAAPVQEEFARMIRVMKWQNHSVFA